MAANYATVLTQMSSIEQQLLQVFQDGTLTAPQKIQRYRQRLGQFDTLYATLSADDQKRLKREQPSLVHNMIMTYLIANRDPNYEDPNYAQANAEQDAGRIAAGTYSRLSSVKFGTIHISAVVEDAEKTALETSLTTIETQLKKDPKAIKVLEEVQRVLKTDAATRNVPLLVTESATHRFSGTNKVYYAQQPPRQPIIGTIILARGVMNDFPLTKELLAFVFQNELFETAWTLLYGTGVQLYSQFGAISATVSFRMYRELLGANPTSQELVAFLDRYENAYDAGGFASGPFPNTGNLKTLVDRLIFFGTKGAFSDLAGLNQR